MATDTISIPVDAASAQLFSEAAPEQRNKLQLLLRLRLRELTTGPQRSLKEIIDEIGASAEATGMTPEVLRSILSDE